MPEHHPQHLHTTAVLRGEPHTAADGTVFPPFREDSFSELVGHQVRVPGLDTQHPHTLVGVDISRDRCSVRLAIRTTLTVGLELDQHLNVSVATPEAHLQLVDAETGDVLLETTHSAPLVEGDHHRVNGQVVQVVGTSWPHRHPEHGSVQAHPETGEYPHDVQQVRVRRVLPAQIEAAHHS